MPYPRWGLAAVNGLDQRLYLAGGSRLEAGGLSDVEVYDPTTNRWSEAAPLPSQTLRPAIAVDPSGRIAVLGGSRGDGTFLTADELLPAANPDAGWSAGVPLLKATAGAGAATVSGSGLLLIGGYADGASTRAVYRLDASLGWQAAGLLSVERDGHVVVELSGSRLFALGGWSNGNFLQHIDVSDPAIDAGSWQRGPTLITPRLRLSASPDPAGAAIWVLGGQTDAGVTAGVEILDLDAGTFVEGPPLPSARAEATALLATADRRLYLLGGIDRTGAALDTVEVYDFSCACWTSSSPP